MKDNWIKIKVSFENFLSKYKELKPSQNISSLNVNKENSDFKDLKKRFEEEKRRIRQVQSEFRQGKNNEGPTGQVLNEIITTIQKEILE